MFKSHAWRCLGLLGQSLQFNFKDLMINLLSLSLLVILAVSRDPTKLAFGSCNKFYQTHKMDIFEKIIAQKPSHMLFLGDFVYLDGFIYPTLPSRWYSEENEDEILRKFNAILNSDQFKAFAKNNITVEIIWDDHDYNLNNGGTSNPMRFKMLEIFKTLFASVTIFEDSLHKLVKIDEKVTVLLLDVRSYKTSDSMFHEQTWNWLQRVFRNTSSDELILISSGIQVIYDDRIMMEKWDINSRVRLYSLLKQYNVHSMILSGDIHFGQMGQRQGLHEITSSGLSFSVADHLMMIEEILTTFIPDTYSKASERYAYRNFGFLEINYTSNNTISHISSQIRNKEGEIALQKIIPFEETMLKEIDWEDLKKDHKHIFEQNMWIKIRENPVRILVYVAFMYPAVYFVLGIIELFHWKID